MSPIATKEEGRLLRGVVGNIYRGGMFLEVMTRRLVKELWIYGRCEDWETGEPTGPEVLVGRLTPAGLAQVVGGVVKLQTGFWHGRPQFDEDRVRLDEAQLKEALRWMEANK